MPTAFSKWHHNISLTLSTILFADLLALPVAALKTPLILTK
jgi:hypothetical protein